MPRLIDTMTDVALSSKVLELFSGSPCLEKGWKRTSDLRQGLETLFAKEPHWSDSLSRADNQTWVFCFVSDDSPKERRYAEWIAEVLDDGYRGPEGLAWTHATPVDLAIRYTPFTLSDSVITQTGTIGLSGLTGVTIKEVEE